MKRRAASSELSSHEIVVVALYLLGGASAPIDTEDIAIRVNELLPGRFTWRKYKEQINLDAVRVFLSDAKKAKNGNLVKGTGREGWQLTREGLAFAKAASRTISAKRTPSVHQMTPRERTWRQAERRRLLGTDAWAKARSEGIESVNRHMAEDFFRLDDYVVGSVRERKIVRVLDAFGDDPELGNLVNGLATKVRDL